jgi:FtsP/CotA-like multicopper oxidase with cupredoxin domain
MAGHDRGSMAHTEPVPNLIETAPWPGLFEAPLATDAHDEADVVEVTLEATESEVEIAPGHRVKLWTYNQTLPGPTIEARVGDTIRIHFRNSLPEPTTIHWHGLRVPAAMDGVTAAQTPIQPGEEFTYEFVAEDSGTFWYHPPSARMNRSNEDSTERSSCATPTNQSSRARTRSSSTTFCSTEPGS